jgi:arylsulfatase A-like enzyme
MLLSGRWPFQTGVVDNSMRLRDEGSSLGEAFRSSGYHTGYIGKWHLSPEPEFIAPSSGRHGFDDWQAWFATRTHLRQITYDAETGEEIAREGYSCVSMTDAALDFIDTARQPWMLVLSWVPPHPPFEQAPVDKMRLYDKKTLQFRPNVPPRLRSRRELAEYLCGYYGHISALDAQLGRLLDKLDRTGHAANTIVVYTSDHGTMLGSHGVGGKRLPFDEACRVPFLVRYPGVVDAGRETKRILTAIDLFPSICGLAGVPIPSSCEGTDLSAAMRTGNDASSESAFLMHIQKKNAEADGPGRLAPLFRGVRTERFTYAVAADGRWCLYDDYDDPYQTHNLIADPAYSKTANELDGLVSDWLRVARDHFPLDTLRKKRSRLAFPTPTEP